MSDFLDFLLSSPTKSPLPIEITSTTTLEDIIAATIQPETTTSDVTTPSVSTDTISTTDPTTTSKDDDDEALAAAILAEATDLEPETETRLADSLFGLLGSPPPEQLLTNNSAVLELQSLLKTELKQQTIPETLMSLLHKPKISVFTREQQLQRQFTKLEVSSPTQVSQLSSFFKYQSAVIETERYQSLHQNATKPHLQNSINNHFDEQLHKAIDRVEVSVSNLQQAVSNQIPTTTTKTSATRLSTLRSRPQLSRRSVQLMEEWYHCNIDHPYPDSTIIQSIALQGKHQRRTSQEVVCQQTLFSDITLPLMDKPILKIPSKLKEFIRTAKDDVEKRLHDEQKVIHKIKRMSKAKEFHMSEEEKKKRRKSKKKAMENGQPESSSSSTAVTSSENPTTPVTPTTPASPESSKSS
ncbi:PXK [Mytilus coruscus]|uniref:PXK n=1 Tax=Mytilus coruscus TaxID=42192 RepID=A0A6J8DLY7_MYTCO|nr:PXK [Mytilus coruscus]